jgi:hypothetical protein
MRAAASVQNVRTSRLVMYRLSVNVDLFSDARSLEAMRLPFLGAMWGMLQNPPASLEREL